MQENALGKAITSIESTKIKVAELTEKVAVVEKKLSGHQRKQERIRRAFGDTDDEELFVPASKRQCK